MHGGLRGCRVALAPKLGFAMKTVWMYVRHSLVVLLMLGAIAALFGLSQGAEVYYGETTAAFRAGDEGPHVLWRGDGWVSYTVRGNRDDGYRVEERHHGSAGAFPLEVVFPLDQSRFTVQAVPTFTTPPVRYDDGKPIFAISDIEGNYRSFRDFLITAGVIDADLNWTFGEGHLVLLGDFVDRGASVTQVLWLIYRLEQHAKAAGGHVHYILGNHEIKNLQGNTQSANRKYLGVTAILGRQHAELFGDDAFLGRWLASRNTVEMIDGIVFVHGGLHPQLAGRDWSLDDLNRIVREHYRRPWYPRADAGADDFLLDPETGPSWYRGYFKDDPTQDQIEKTLKKFNATAVVVGHTLHWRVHSLYEGRVYAIDVRHPLDHRGSFPPRSAEGLWLEGGKAWRVREDGTRVAL